MSETRVTPEMVEAAAIRVMCGAPRHDAWHIKTGLGTPQERWADAPETDREHWRENARAVLAAAEAARPAPDPRDAALALVLKLHSEDEWGLCRECDITTDTPARWPCETARAARSAGATP